MRALMVTSVSSLVHSSHPFPSLKQREYSQTVTASR
jgi:hypothetical protein